MHRFIEEMRTFAPNVRWVTAESLHITLKFIGEQPDSKVKQIELALAEVRQLSFQLSFGASGFFPNAKSARVFWIGITAGAELAKLAQNVEEVLASLGIEREKRDFSPHLTLARLRGGSGAPGRQKRDKPNQDFTVLQNSLSAISEAEFGTMTAREFFLYRSQLSSKGSQYSKLARFALSEQPA